MASKATSQITFYDIALAPPASETACTPNPWKSRYALNFKKVPYKTTWVPLLDISSVRGAMNIPASRKFADGSPYDTLPVISDPATGRIVGDSFEIAVFLQEQYPEAGDLFPEQKLEYVFGKDPEVFAPIAEAEVEGPAAVYVRFNTNVDAVFSAHARLMACGMPFDPAVVEQCRAKFSERVGVPWEAIVISGEDREKLLKSFEEALGGLAKLYRDTNGPFLMGSRASYADFIVGGWLRMCRGALPGEEWEALKGWHSGLFGRLHEALEEFAQMN
ncbi:hypothetical protein FQN49_003296 [Arthroderma sp. PD_2]|nr:hypothetical protein FQN49_003296 [Arthroderma sp. PD_2]